MKKIRIEGGDLREGKIEIHGYKHAMVQIIAASVALKTPVLIADVPLVDDTFILQEIIQHAGGIFEIKDHRIFLDPREIVNPNIDLELSKKIHGSVYLMPAFALHSGQFCFGEAGGCQIGSLENQGQRPIEHILDVMRLFGIETHYQNGKILGKKIVYEKKVTIDLTHYWGSEEKGGMASMASGATKTALLCSINTPKTTILHPCLKAGAQDLVRFLRQCGYQILICRESLDIVAPSTQISTSSIIPEFQLTKCVSEIITYIALAIHTNTQLILNVGNVGILKSYLNSELKIFRKMGIDIAYTQDKVYIGNRHMIKSVDIDVTNDTIQSDHQPFFTLMLLKGDRPAQIREFVWKDRFAYVNELKKLGAELTQENNVLYIRPSHLTRGNQTLSASDTRAAAVLILASLTVSEPVEIEHIQHLYRGYESLLSSIQSLGANFKLITT